jgi:predicted RNA-binding protein with PIN domain
MATERLIIVDGYNVILRTPQLKPGEGRTLREARTKLLNLMSWAFAPGDVQFIVVFDGADGPAPSERKGRIEVRYSRPPHKADDVIRELVEERVQKVERLTVVTSDLEVARHARAMGADIALADLFVASVLGPAASETPEKPSSTLSRKELEEWAKLFRAPRPGEARGNGDDEE